MADWTRRFYLSALWLHKRQDILERDNYECQEHKRKGKFKKAECVHHKQHLRHRPDLALDDNNLEALCNSCHDVKHPEKLHKKIKKKFVNEEKW